MDDIRRYSYDDARTFGVDRLVTRAQIVEALSYARDRDDVTTERACLAALGTRRGAIGSFGTKRR